jgi:hypothetical protein
MDVRSIIIDHLGPIGPAILRLLSLSPVRLELISLSAVRQSLQFYSYANHCGREIVLGKKA